LPLKGTKKKITFRRGASGTVVGRKPVEKERSMM